MNSIDNGRQNGVVAIFGEGKLADAVYGELAEKVEVVRLPDIGHDLPLNAALALVLHDSWQPRDHGRAEACLRQAGVPWLRGFIAFGEGIAGPLVSPGQPGCSQCADTRMLMAGRDRRETWQLRQHLAGGETRPRDAWASPAGLRHMAQLLAAETQKALCGVRSRLRESIYIFELKTLACTSHFFLPDPSCPVCGSLPDDSPELAALAPKPSPKVGGSYRSRPLSELKGVLPELYVDYRAGFLNGKMLDLASPFADASVNLPLLGYDEMTAGRTHRYADSELTAIMEGLERYCGMAPRGKRPVVRASYREAAREALDPASVGLYAKEQYERPGFPFVPFHPDEPLEWVWGYSFRRQRPILVPQQLAYYSSGCGGKGFVYETSNGCALGGSLEEAILYGMLEVIERDSFLLAWYARLPLPRLDPRSADDAELDLMLDRLHAVAGFELHLYDATMENGVPAVWAIAKNTKAKGIHLVCAAGAHPDPVRATKGVLHEISGMTLTLDGKIEANRAEYERMLDDPWRVTGMEHHSMLYGLPQAEDRLAFLLGQNAPLRTFAEQFGRPSAHADLTDDLLELLGRFDRLGLDVVVVDQTTPELERSGLHCVKVLIPGMLPMTFGHHLVRLEGLDRVLNVPMALGFTKRPLRREQLNLHPHPFP